MQEIRCDRMRLIGSSRAGISTVVAVPSLRSLFDVGNCPPELSRYGRLFLTHLHADHCGGLVSYLNLRRLFAQGMATIYVPAAEVPLLDDVLRSTALAARQRWEYVVIPLTAGQAKDLSPELTVQPFATDHRVPSLGYGFFQRRRKLRPEYEGMPSDRLMELMRGGVNVHEREEIPILTFLGDSGPAPLDRYEWIGRSEVAVIECTFLRPDHLHLAREFGHMHLEDLLRRADQLRCKHLILTHFSQRYRPEEIQETLKRELPPDLHERVQVLL